MPAQDEDHAATILGRKASGLLALDEAFIELSDADCFAAIAAVIAERVHLPAETVAEALEATSDEPISVMCRAGGFSLNGFSALLRMRRRRNHGRRSAAAALAFFSGLNRTAAEHSLQEMAPRPTRALARRAR